MRVQAYELMGIEIDLLKLELKLAAILHQDSNSQRLGLRSEERNEEGYRYCPLDRVGELFIAQLFK